MSLPPLSPLPRQTTYDVVIIGGAMLGTAVAWFLSADRSFKGRVLVVERDPTYAHAATSLTNSCIRQQYSNPLNIRVSQFGASYIKSFRDQLGGDPEVPDIRLHNFGYMYLAGTEAQADALRAAQKTQAACGAATRLLTPDQIRAEFPFYVVDDIVLGSHNGVDEGYFDGASMFDWWRRRARQNGVEYVTNEVVGIERAGDRVTAVSLASGERIGCGTIVNASGTRGAATARMAGIDIPIEPRRRYSFVFAAQNPPRQDVPLTIDPSGVHVRTDGAYYLAGCPADPDPAVAFDDFALEHAVWDDRIWPTIAARIPAFEQVRVLNAWIGHYDFNTLDHNAIVGPHTEVSNFLLLNGFSGHGLQQSPAMGRGLAEWIVHGRYVTLDLTPLGYGRIARGEPFPEHAII